MFEQNDEAAMLQGEHEAEKMIVEAYAALLLAFLSTERFVLCISFSSFLYKAFTPLMIHCKQFERTRVYC